MACRFVHTADWQLGKPFVRMEGDTGARLRQARFDAVRKVATIATDRRADAVLVAGDSFDSHLPGDATIHRALDVMQPFAGPWVILPGNHDPGESAAPLWDRLELLALERGNIQIRVARSREPMRLADDRLEILPAPLRHRDDPDDPTAWFHGLARQPGIIRTGLAHGSVYGFDHGDGEAANLIAPDLAEKSGLDYLALGDWHGTQSITRRCWYSGTPEPDRFRNNDPGHALWVEIDEAGMMPRVERLETATFSWQMAAFDQIDETDGLIEQVEGLLRQSMPADRMLLQLQFDGEIDLAGRARLDERIETWRLRLCHLDVDDRLVERPSDQDWSELRLHGLASSVAERLSQMASDPGSDEAEAARMALRRLYLIQHRISGAG